MAGMAAIAGTPARMHLVNLATGEDVEALFNPETLQEELAVIYGRVVIPGMSHQPLQYSYTGNHGLTLDLYTRGNTEGERVLLEDFRRFLLSLAYPNGDAGTIDDGAPPRILFIWPLVFSWTCVLTNYRGALSQFAQSGRISRSMASITLEEIRDVRLTSEDVRRHGTNRSTSGDGQQSA